MSATVSVKQVVGGGAGTATTITNLRHNTDDTINPGTTNPLVKPAAGTNYGYWKTVYLNADTAPSNVINNVRFFSDGTVGWTGVTLYSGTTTAYTQATGTAGTTGDVSSVATTNIETYTSGSPLSVSGSITAATGVISANVILQARVSTSAVAGTLAQETTTFRYDET
jgi:hypothetical protein